MSQQINHIMNGDKMGANYLNAVTGANYMLTDLHINSDFICEKEILKGSLKKYKVLLLPCTYVISEECAKAIAQFVEEGGSVIADYILAEKRPGGLCYIDLPGAGFTKVFGIEREDALYIAHPTLERENNLGIKVGTMVEQVIPVTAKSIGGEYMPEYPLITENTYGKGRATYVATQYFSKYATAPQKELRDVLCGMLEKVGVVPYTNFENEDNKPQTPLVTSALYDEKGEVKVITVTNTNYDTVSDTLTLPDGEYMLSEEKEAFEIVKEKGEIKAKFTLTGLESLAIYKI
jgi:beta-galactosidase GanA